MLWSILIIIATFFNFQNFTYFFIQPILLRKIKLTYWRFCLEYNFKRKFIASSEIAMAGGRWKGSVLCLCADREQSWWSEELIPSPYFCFPMFNFFNRDDSPNGRNISLAPWGLWGIWALEASYCTCIKLYKILFLIE